MLKHLLFFRRATGFRDQEPLWCCFLSLLNSILGILSKNKTHELQLYCFDSCNECNMATDFGSDTFVWKNFKEVSFFASRLFPVRFTIFGGGTFLCLSRTDRGARRSGRKACKVKVHRKIPICNNLRKSCPTVFSNGRGVTTAQSFGFIGGNGTQPLNLVPVLSSSGSK